MSSSSKKIDAFKIPLKKIVKATNNFENLIGEGGFGKVYKGNLYWFGKRTDIAARRLHSDYGQGDLEFWNEISMLGLSNLKYDNLVSFVGFCDEEDQKIIITEYEAKQSLDVHLKDLNLTWTQRLRICVGIARALSYIHYDEGHNLSVIHRNIKSSKVLLDDNWKPKLSGFGVSLKNSKARRHRYFLADEVIGTIGYIDPTYEKTGFVTHKSDVFSFGVLLFEVLCGRKAFTPDEQELQSPQLFKYEYKEGNVEDDAVKLDGISDPHLHTNKKPRESNSIHIPDDDGYRRPALFLATQSKSLDGGYRRLATFVVRQTSSFNGGNSQSTSFVDRKPSSFSGRNSRSTSYVDRHPSSSNGGNSQSISYLDTQPSSSNGGNSQSASFVDRQPPSLFGDNNQPASFFGGQPSSSIYGTEEENDKPDSISDYKIGPNNCVPIESFNDKPRSIDFLATDDQVDSSSYMTAPSLANEPFAAYDTSPAIVTTSLTVNVPTTSPAMGTTTSPLNAPPDFVGSTLSPVDDQLPIQNASSVDHDFKLHPLYTMKKLEQYIHSPNEELLTQSVKYHYDDLENYLDLDDMIDQALKEQMDPISFKIFSETAFSCLKEQRSQRPNIDLILKNLKIALAHQIKHENPEQSQIPGEVEGTLSSSKRLEGGDLDHLKIPLTEIEMATKKFTQNYLGSGTYGKVYKADLKLLLEENDQGEIAKKRTVAIKCIRDDKQGKEGFIAEIELLASCKHPNIVSLLGFCDEGPNMILVYEYASNKSLDNYLGGSTANSIILTWIQRLKICIDIARGLNYLHTRDEDEHKIVHRDLKSGNILLGHNWVAKIADFGLSRFNRVDEEGKTFYTGTIAGTMEYMCPEYKMSGRLKREIDIYSLGVVLLEILSGKLAYDDIFIEENETGIAHVARRRLKEGTINDLVDQKIMEEVDELTSTLNKGPNQESLKTFIEITCKCIEESQDNRPTAKVVMEKLQEALLIQEKNKDNLRMSFADIELATEKFSSKNFIGGGGFGPVYKGNVGINTIAAKRLKKLHGQGETHFLTELEILFDYKHENIIRLEGYCNEKDEKIIVYEYAPEGSLERHLKNNSLTWIKRLQICIDVACGLAYLHSGAQANEMVIHRDIKCANILVNSDWKAKISDFGLSSITTINQEDISHLVGTNGYVDPEYESTGFFTAKSDIYSFGVVLFEILYGKLVAPDTKNYDQNRVDNILKDIHIKENLDYIVFLDIKRQIAPKSLSTFREIVSQCLQFDRESRPTAQQVLQKLTTALEFQEEYEIWQPKLPKDYKEIIQMSKFPGIYSTKNNKDLYNILSNGILLPKDKVWFSLGNNGERNEMISARKFSYKNRRLHLWRSVPESRFQKVAKLLDISNLKIQIQVKTQFLSQDVTYGVHLVFKFCDRSISSKPMYVNLTYRMESNILHSYFATSRDDKWMMIELCRFLNHKEHNDFSVLLESLSRYYCGSDAIYVEGIEFRAMDKVKNDKPKEVQTVLESASMDNVQKLPTDCDDIIKRSTQFHDSSKEELYSLLINWILIDNDEKLFSLSKINGKKCHMLPAKAVLCDSSNVKLFALRDSVHSRFYKEVELLSPPQFRIQCKIESQLLSSDTQYRCCLVYKISEKCRGLHYPVRVRDQRHRKNKVVGILYFRSPSLINLHDTFRVPEERKDGWMEVKVWEFRTDIEQKDSHVPMNLKLISFEGNLNGLILYGLEFQPM